MTDALDRCLRHVVPDIVTGCWLYVGTLNRKGYGKFSVNHIIKGLLAHRFVYTELKGPIPAGMCLDHLCRHRNCVNPDHLEPVTQAENIRRGLGNKRDNGNSKKTTCKHGHPLTEDNIYRPPSGGRHCVTCDKLRCRLRRTRKEVAP